MSETPTTLLQAFLSRHNVCDGRLIVAVSGGADSVSLLLLLRESAAEFNIQLLVGHFDHGLREDSAQDADWVKGVCERLDIPCFVGANRASGQDERKSSVEERARHQRYAFLSQLAEEQQAAWIAVAHSADDQTETVLHHIARGTGLRGLQGIPEVREIHQQLRVIRPLLAVHRQDLIQELKHRSQDYLTDETNLNRELTRNRIRHDILPYLREKLNPQIDAALRRLAAQAGEAQSAIHFLAVNLLKASFVSEDSGVTRLSVSPMQTQPTAVVIASFVELWTQQNWPRQEMTSQHWYQLAGLALHGSPVAVTCPGSIQVRRRRQVLEICLPMDRD